MYFGGIPRSSGEKEPKKNKKKCLFRKYRTNTSIVLVQDKRILVQYEFVLNQYQPKWVISDDLNEIDKFFRAGALYVYVFCVPRGHSPTI